MEYGNLQVVVVDNDSQDGSPEEIRRTFPQVRLIANQSNLGFGAACNLGFEAGLEDEADYFLLLNQDIIAAPDLAQVLVSSARERPGAALFGPKTFFLDPGPDGQPRIQYAGAWRRLLPLRFLVPGIGAPDSERFNRPCRVDAVWGHGMLIRGRALKRVGLFDTDFFMYHEDIDLCRRMQMAGYEVFYEPRAVVWHDLADSDRATESEEWRWRYKVDSAWTFHRKHYGRFRAWILTPLNVLDETQHLLMRGRIRAAFHLGRVFLRSVSDRLAQNRME